jgi:TolA-binding protein
MSSLQAVKSLRQQIRSMQREIDELKRQRFVAEQKAENRLMYLNTKFNWFIDLLAEGKTPSLPWMTKDLKDFLVRTK